MASKEEKEQGQQEPHNRPTAAKAKVRVFFNSVWKPSVNVGETEMHWGTVFTLVNDKGRFEAETEVELVQSLIDEGKVALV